MSTQAPKATSRILMAFSVLAAILSATIAWLFRDWSLTGFFLAVSIAAAGMAAAVMPGRNEPSNE